MSAEHSSPPPGESVLEAWFEDGTVRCELVVAAGADRDHVRAQILTLLTEATSGQYWAGRWKHVALDERWHGLLVTIDEADAELGRSPHDAHHTKRVAARQLVEAARDYLEQLG